MEYIIDIIPGYGCNFRCKYCFEKLSEHNYINKFMSNDIINETIKYIENFISYKSLGDKNFKLRLVFYGGEPLLYLDVIEKIINGLNKYDNINYYIVTNGYLISKKIKILNELKDKTNNHLFISISYDYFLQEKNRNKDTYNYIRNNIFYLYRNNFKVSTISVFPKSDLQYFCETFLDFLKLKKKIPSLIFRFNIDRLNVSDSIFNYEKTEESLKKFFNYIRLNNYNVSDFICYNEDSGYRKFRLKDCIYANVYCAIDINGDIYPACNSVFSSDKIKNMLLLGNVKEDSNILFNRHNRIVNSLNLDIPEKCKICNNICRVMPWRTIKNDISGINGMPSKEHCVIHGLLTKYLI